MKTVASVLLTAGVAFAGGRSEAQDFYYVPRASYGSGFYGSYASGGNGYAAARSHAAFNHNEYDRRSYHAQAHQFPMTWGQDARLHRQLNHSRLHDAVRHEQSHRGYPPAYGGSGAY